MPVPPARPAELELAVAMAEKTSPIALKWFSSDSLVIRRKDDGSPVTQADQAVERCLREIVAEADPEAGVIGEEEGSNIKESPRKWFFDPIDGTTSFIHGVPLFSTLIALYDEHGPAIGVISSPALGEVVAAGRGLGCTFNGKPCSVSSKSSLEGAVVTTWGYEKWTPSLLERFQAAKALLRGWGDAYGWALVATGRAEVVLDPWVSEWDVAPMPVILAEAGGHYSTWTGEVAIDQSSGVGTNGHLHREVLDIIADYVS